MNTRFIFFLSKSEDLNFDQKLEKKISSLRILFLFYKFHWPRDWTNPLPERRIISWKVFWSDHSVDQYELELWLGTAMACCVLACCVILHFRPSIEETILRSKFSWQKKKMTFQVRWRARDKKDI